MEGCSPQYLAARVLDAREQDIGRAGRRPGSRTEPGPHLGLSQDSRTVPTGVHSHPVSTAMFCFLESVFSLGHEPLVLHFAA